MLCYIGHGAKNGWGLSGYNDAEVLTYENLNLLLSLHHGNLIFLNNCCYAMAAENAVSSRFGDYFLIGASLADATAHGDWLLDVVLNSWRSRQLFSSHIGPHIAGRVKLWAGNEELSNLMISRVIKPLLLCWDGKELKNEI